jgi:hypothetical protein
MRRSEALQGVRVIKFMSILSRCEAAELNVARAGLFQHKRPRAEVVFYATSAFFGRPTCPSRSMRSAGPSGNRATISRLPPAAST